MKCSISQLFFGYSFGDLDHLFPECCSHNEVKIMSSAFPSSFTLRYFHVQDLSASSHWTSKQVLEETAGPACSRFLSWIMPNIRYLVFVGFYLSSKWENYRILYSNCWHCWCFVVFDLSEVIASVSTLQRRILSVWVQQCFLLLLLNLLSLI